MDATELIKKVRKIEIRSKGLSNQIFSGEYHSKFKGSGMTFSEVREYQHGDDIRNIDWNVTARFNHPFIKVFDEEREMTVMLIIDLSQSANLGSKLRSKKELITEIAAVLSFAAMQNNDKVGVILFTDKVEKFISPQKGRKHVLRIIRELIGFEPLNKQTNLTEALRFFTNMVKKRCTAFILSDFLTDNYKDALRIAARKHDTIAIHISDLFDEELPNAGLIKLTDKENGNDIWVDSSDKNVRSLYKANALRLKDETFTIFRKSNVDACSLKTHENYVKPLIELFKKRAV